MRTLLLALLIPRLVLGETRFETITETYRGRDYVVRVPVGDGEITNEDFPDEMLLGLSSHGHFYLLVADKQISGSFPPVPTMVLDRAIHPGILIRFPDVPKEKVQQLREKLGKEFPIQGLSWSCVDTACSNLRQGSGTHLKAGRGELFASSTFDGILREGFVDNEGRPVRFEIYKTDRSQGDLAARVPSAAAHDAAYTAFTGFLAFVGVVLANEARKGLYVRNRAWCDRAFRKMRTWRAKTDALPVP